MKCTFDVYKLICIHVPCLFVLEYFEYICPVSFCFWVFGIYYMSFLSSEYLEYFAPDFLLHPDISTKQENLNTKQVNWMFRMWFWPVKALKINSMPFLALFVNQQNNLLGYYTFSGILIISKVVSTEKKTQLYFCSSAK